MKRFGSTAAVLMLTGCAAAPTAVDWRQVEACRDVCAVRGTVAATAVDGSVVRLYFDPDRREVSVAIIQGWLSGFPVGPENYYRGKEIVATGSLRRFHGQVDVVVRDPSAITLVSEVPPATPDTYTAPTPQNMDEIRERMRQLERRVHELEEQKTP